MSNTNEGSGLTFLVFLKHTAIIGICLFALENSAWLDEIAPDLWMMIVMTLVLIFIASIMASFEEFYGLGFLNRKFLKSCNVVFFGIMPMIYTAVFYGAIYRYIEKRHTGSFNIDEPKNMLNFLYHSCAASFSFSNINPKTPIAKMVVLTHSIFNLVLVVLFINRISDLISKIHHPENGSEILK